VSTFVLVHGAWHGAWCWDLLRPELAERGHDVVTMDLPCDDPSATFDTYADVVCEAMDRHADPEPVLVGHSLAGHTVPLVAARRPLRRVVYLCALVPAPGLSFNDQNRGGVIVDPTALDGLGAIDEQGCRTWLDRELTDRAFLDDCSDSVAEWAFSRLRPQAFGRYVEPCALDELPSVAATSVICTEDRVVNVQWQRRIAQRLGADVVEMRGSHSPYLSRPAELADVLDGLADT
jgi:pimeloyl-ACP methyl ester carboxylesterase